MITSFQIYESFLNKTIDLKSDLIDILNDIDMDIMDHIDIKNEDIYLLLYYDDVLLLKLIYNNINENYFYNSMLEKTFKNRDISYDEYKSYIKSNLSCLYNLKFNSFTVESFYVLNCLKTKCLFFNNEIFNSKVMKYITNNNSILYILKNFKNVLTTDNSKKSKILKRYYL